MSNQEGYATPHDVAPPRPRSSHPPSRRAVQRFGVIQAPFRRLVGVVDNPPRLIGKRL